MIKISVGNPNANFWIRRSGSKKSVGEVLKDYLPDAFGVVVDTNKVDPKFAYYYFSWIHGGGLYENISCGSIALQHIKKQNILNFWRYSNESSNFA